MSEDVEDTTDFDRLAKEFASTPDLIDTLVKPVTNGIEMEVFAESRVGKILIGEAMEAARDALMAILDTNSSDQLLQTAVMELRVRHRLLGSIKNTISGGRNAERKIRLMDQQPDSGSTDE